MHVSTCLTCISVDENNGCHCNKQEGSWGSVTIYTNIQPQTLSTHPDSYPQQKFNEKISPYEHYEYHRNPPATQDGTSRPVKLRKVYINHLLPSHLPPKLSNWTASKYQIPYISADTV